MRSSFTIFLLGLVIGSTLGIGGIWTQVVQPAAKQINDLNQEHGVMEAALDEAGSTLREVAEELRKEATGGERGAPGPIPSGGVIPSGLAPSGISPISGTSAVKSSDNASASNPTALADKLDSLASKLDVAKGTDK